MRLVVWNIRAGGGKRADGIAAQISRWKPDVVALSEFRGTPASQQIARDINELAGLCFQRTTASRQEPARNALLVASRWPLRRVRLGVPVPDPLRWLHVNVAAPTPIAFIAVHVPNRVTGRKVPFLDCVSRVAGNWRGPPGIIAGDTNSGRIHLDEENPAFDRIEDTWIQGMDTLGWRDAWRNLYPDGKGYTWYSPNGRNGFRLDQAFVHDAIWPIVSNVRHVWAGATRERREVLSDHAALLIDLKL